MRALVYFMALTNLTTLPIATAGLENATGGLLPNPDWSRLSAAVALQVHRLKAAPSPTPGQAMPSQNQELSSTKSTASYLSTAVMISPWVGVTAGHSLKQILSASVSIEPKYAGQNKKFKVKSWAIFDESMNPSQIQGIDLGVFFMEDPVHLPEYFIPKPLSHAQLLIEPLQRLGYGGRNGENNRTWVAESYPRRITGNNYLTAYDQFGFVGDSGGPLYRIAREQSQSQQPQALELVGIHVGRMMGYGGYLQNQSNALILDAQLIQWINQKAQGWAARASNPEAMIP